MKLILYQATFAITEIDFVPVPFRCQIKQQHLDFAVVYHLVYLGTQVKSKEHQKTTNFTIPKKMVGIPMISFEF